MSGSGEAASVAPPAGSAAALDEVLVPELVSLKTCVPIAAQRVPRLSRSERGDARCHSLTRGSLAVVSRSFGSASILALACTNRTYAVGLKLDVQRATALFVVRPLRFVAHEVVAEDYFRGRIHFYLLAWTGGRPCRSSPTSRRRI